MIHCYQILNKFYQIWCQNSQNLVTLPNGFSGVCAVDDGEPVFGDEERGDGSQEDEGHILEDGAELGEGDGRAVAVCGTGGWREVAVKVEQGFAVHGGL